METDKIYLGDSLEVLKTFEDNSIDCCVTSPPYYALRDYGTGTWVGGNPDCPHYRVSKKSDKTITGHKRMQENCSPVGDAIYKNVCPLCGAIRVDNQIGLEETPEKYIERLTEVFMEVHRVLKPNGTLWLNIGDSYNSSPKGNTSPSGFQSKNYGINDKQKDRASKFKTMLANGIKQKDLIGIPWMLAFSLRNAGWYLRQDIIWHKGNPMPESVTDRCTKSHEYIFLMSKSQKYYFDNEAIQEEANPNYISKNIRFGGNKYGNNDDPLFQIYSGNVYEPKTKVRTQNNGYSKAGGHRDNSGGFGYTMLKDGDNNEMYYVRNKRDVWTINPKHNKEAHYATYPPELVSNCILAGCPEGGIVLDPFMGSGTTGIVANKLGRHYVGIELNPEYVEMAERRIKLEQSQLKLF